MLLSRKIAGEFAAVFLIGAVVGGLVVWDATTDSELKDLKELKKFMTQSNDPDKVIVARINQKYIDEFHLTPEELERIQPLIAGMAQHVSHIRRQFGVDIISTYADYRGRIAEQLSPEHRAAFEAATAERKKQLNSLLLLDPNPSLTPKSQGQK